MQIHLLSAVAVAALAAAACTKRDNYAEEDSETTVADHQTTPSTVPPPVADTTPLSQAPSTTPTEPMTPGTEPEDPVAGDEPGTETGMNTVPGADAPTTGPAETAAEAPVVVAIATVKSKTDAERVAENAFAQADTDGNGELSRAEYLRIAEGVSSEGGAGASAEASGVDASGTTALVDESAVNTAFQEAAAGDDALSIDKFKEAMVKRFEEADADDNNELNENERQTFAGLIAGKETPAQ